MSHITNFSISSKFVQEERERKYPRPRTLRISNEVISSALYKNQTVLLFANIEEGSTPILVKCENQSLNNEVANYVISLFN